MSVRLIFPKGNYWTAEELELLAWFTTKRPQLPSESFELSPGVHVTGPETFYDSLESNIAAGPDSARARGGLQHDLLKLKEQFDREDSRA